MASDPPPSWPWPQPQARGARGGSKEYAEWRARWHHGRNDTLEEAAWAT